MQIKADISGDIRGAVFLVQHSTAPIVEEAYQVVGRIIAELKRDGILRPIGKGFYEYDRMALKHRADL